MRRKNILGLLGLMALTVMALSSCNGTDNRMDSEPQAAGDGTDGGELRIAYIELDSLPTQYKFCVDYTIILEKKSTNARNTLNTKGNQLQTAANNFQEKLNNNGFSSEAEAQKAYNAIQKSNQDLQSLQARLESELQTETAKYNAALMDSLQNFIQDYNKGGKYDYILIRQGLNLLYANKKYDITDDVIKGLNKRYKPIAEEKK